MTPHEAVNAFKGTMTDAAMRQAWRDLEDGGCRIHRYHPSAHAASENLWRMHITNPAWTGPFDPENGIRVYYEQRADGSWHTME